MNKKLIPLLVAGTALLAGCDQQMNSTTGSNTAAPAAVIKKEDAIASVNGQFISKATLAELEKEIAEKAHGQAFPKEKLIEELVQRELLIQDAVKKQLDKSPDMQKQLDLARKSLLTQADLQDFVKKNPVTDAEIKAEYDAKVGGTNATEYKARHILVKTEDEAKKLIAALDKGGDFAKLANQNSLDAKESKNGGDLGWFNPGQMVAPFSEAVAKLEKGKYSKVPVKTQFGFHIILREDSRAQTPPPFDSVKDQITPSLQRQKIQKMLEGLRTQAKVEILIPVTDDKAKVVAPATVPGANPAATAPTPAAGSALGAEVAPVEQPATIEPAPDAAPVPTAAPAAVPAPAAPAPKPEPAKK
ncbi:peptidylprolyl isomerase [Crenothrix polyspora]|uniref:peptidylprolyl isomerase n=1 Tax=Crenothrix polyspora TaxID=360316 RepID=A0A1R4H7Z1_9GAMM|nr:peptidylprolyl isomerase [Crenothrix polyspora]SJM92287.1 Parvulin-like peptidyl-prolyl isomerase [Crenothrix polyspora]